MSERVVTLENMTEEDELRIVRNFYEALARIISDREGVIITIKEIRKKPQV